MSETQEPIEIFYFSILRKLLDTQGFVLAVKAHSAGFL